MDDPNMLDRIKRWLKERGLWSFGYEQENFHGHHQLIRVWGLLFPSRWEVYRWPVGTGSEDLARWMLPLKAGSSEARHRIQLSSELVYSGKSWDDAKKAFSGSYPDGTTDATRPRG